MRRPRRRAPDVVDTGWADGPAGAAPAWPVAPGGPEPWAAGGAAPSGAEHGPVMAGGGPTASHRVAAPAGSGWSPGAGGPMPSDPEYHEAVAAAEAAAYNGYESLPAGRVKVVERFKGPRLKHRTGVLRRLRSLVLLVVIGVILAAALATALALVVWGISLAVHSATTN